MSGVFNESFSIGVGGTTGLANGIPTGGDGIGVVPKPWYVSNFRRRARKSRKKRKIRVVVED